MIRNLVWCGVVAAFSGAALGQPVLYGVRGNGDLLRINPQTGAGELIGSSGVGCTSAGAVGWVNAEGIMVGGGADPDLISYLDRFTGAVFKTRTMTGRPAGYTLSGLSSGGLAVFGAADPAGIDLLGSVDPSTGAARVIGPTGQRDIEAVAAGPDVVYGLGTGSGRLYRVDRNTGAATVIGAGEYGGSRAMAVGPDGRLLVCGENLYSVDTQTGAAALIGPTGFTDIRGLTVVARVSCYANCDFSCNPPPCLNVNDFICFQFRYAEGDPYANCDQSTTPPVLNVADFICFMNSFTAGCP